MTYNPFNRVHTTVDAAGHTSTYTYDAGDRGSEGQVSNLELIKNGSRFTS